MVSNTNKTSIIYNINILNVYIMCIYIMCIYILNI